jgi:hypothetical protein
MKLDKIVQLALRRWVRGFGKICAIFHNPPELCLHERKIGSEGGFPSWFTTLGSQVDQSKD